MTGNMEEDWKEKMWTSSRDRIAEAYRRASSMYVFAFSRSPPMFSSFSSFKGVPSSLRREFPTILANVAAICGGRVCSGEFYIRGIKIHVYISISFVACDSLRCESL